MQLPKQFGKPRSDLATALQDDRLDDRSDEQLQMPGPDSVPVSAADGPVLRQRGPEPPHRVAAPDWNHLHVHRRQVQRNLSHQDPHLLRKNCVF